MTNLLSSISGSFGKSLILGSFFPASVFLILFWVLVSPFGIIDLTVLAFLEDIWPGWQLLILTFVAIVLSGLLYNLNLPIIRFYEGYPWQNSFLGSRRTKYYRNKYRASKARSDGLRNLLEVISEGDAYNKLRRERIKHSRIINNEFPTKEDMILPTRLGNTIRSFETYSIRQYGIRSITLYPRLISKIDAGYAASLDDAKTRFDFMLNCSFLSAVMVLLLLAIGLWNPPVLLSNLSLWLIETVIFAVLAYLFYLWSIDAAEGWGDYVKGAFDLYRWDLLKQMGYKQEPSTKREERAIWEQIFYEMAFGDASKGPRIDYGVKESKPSTYAEDKSGSQGLELVRGVDFRVINGTISVTLQVENNGKQKAEKLLLVDTLPADYEFIWESTKLYRLNNGVDSNVKVTGINPYKFDIGNLEVGEKVMLTYNMIKRD